MKFKSLFLDYFLINNITYIKFTGKTDNYHIDLTKKTLKKFEINKTKEITKEQNIFGNKTKQIYLKSTGYYYTNLVSLGSNISIFNKLLDKKINYQTKVLDINSLIFAYEYSKIDSTFKVKNDILKYKNLSPHKRLLIELILLKNNEINTNIVLQSIENDIQKKTKNFVVNNSFKELKNNGSSHEYGYWLNYVLDYYKMNDHNFLLKKITILFEELHLIFVKQKIYYHDVIGKNKDIINISGVILIAKAMLRFALITKDLRFANVAFHLIDFVKKVQLINGGYIQNTLPIYKGNSKFKFPTWTLNYFLEVLLLKKTVLNEFENSIFN